MKPQLFLPDNFSIAEIRYREAPLGEREKIEPVLARYFEEFQIVRIDEFDGTEVNSQNFRITCKTTGEKETTVFLKRYASLPSDQITFQLNFLKDLSVRGVKVNQAIVARDGSSWVTEGGKRYAVFHYLTASHFAPNQASWLSVSREIGVLHRAFRDLKEKYFSEIETLSRNNTSPGAYFNKITHYTDADIGEIKHAQQKNAQGVPNEIFIAAIDALEYAMGVMKKTDSYLIDKDIIHSDLHPHNILMDGDTVAAIIDFDSLRASEIARDAAFFLYRFGRQFFVSDNGSDDMPQIKAQAQVLRESALAVYLQECPLSPEESNAMGMLLLDEFIVKMLFVLRGVYLEGNTAWASNLPKFTMALYEIEVFFSE